MGINSYSLSNRRARRRKSKIAGAHFSMAAGITMVLRALKSSLAARMKTAIPIDAELYNMLLKAFSAASDREQLIIPGDSIVRQNLWRDFGVICTRAGLKKWPDWCHVLRKSCETDWAQKFPQYVVSTWSGHSIDVSAQYYLQVPEQLYKKASEDDTSCVATNCHKQE